MQYENYNETEILALMRNEDEFLKYVVRCKQKNLHTQLHPIIWAIHFNISKYKRLQILEKIVNESIAYVRTHYSFLPEKQVIGKAYSVLGIPTTCDKPNKWFLKVYKKYKSYYPLRCPKNNEIDIFNDSVVNDSSETNTRNYNEDFTKHIITNSTPNMQKIPNYNYYSLPSSIRISEERKSPSSLSTNSFYKDSDLNVQNVTEISINNNTDDNSIEILQLLKTIKQPNDLNVHNISQQTFHDIDIQNTDGIKTKYLNDSQDQIHFISRDPEYIKVENDISKLDECNLSEAWNKKSSSNKTENNDNSISVYFENSERLKYIFEKSSIVNQVGNKSFVSRQCISEELERNLINNSYTRNPISFSSADIQTPKRKNTSYLKCHTSELSTSTQFSFSDISFSGIHQAQTPITTKRLGTPTMDKYYNKIKRASIKLRNNGMWERNASDCNIDTESQNYDSEENRVFSGNNSPKELTDLSSDHEKNKNNKISTNTSSSSTFTTNSHVQSYSINNSRRLDIPINHEWLDNSSKYESNNDDDKSTEHDKENATLLNNKLFKKILYKKSDINISWSVTDISSIL